MFEKKRHHCPYTRTTTHTPTLPNIDVMAPPRPIAALPVSVASQLRSGIVIPSLPAVLVELVQNSLDARARSIAVVVDLDRWSIRCDDDGCGLGRDDLRCVGRERYWTTKDNDGDQTFGFRGEALASVAQVAVLEILTRRDTDGAGEGDGETHELLVRDGIVAREGVARSKRTAAGTTVWARDIFYKARFKPCCWNDRADNDCTCSGPSAAGHTPLRPLDRPSSHPFATPSRHSHCCIHSFPSL